MEITPTLWLRAPANAASFALREWFAWRRGKPTLKGVPWESTFSHWPRNLQATLYPKAEDLIRRFGLERFSGVLSRGQWAKNLYWLDILQTTLQPHLPSHSDCNAEPSGDSEFRVLDVGTADWDYVFALHRFCQHFPSLQLTGLEIDGHGIYPDGFSRADYTAAYIAALSDPKIAMIYGDATKITLPPQDLVICLFPFILPYQILAWGLPLRLLQPENVLACQAQWVKPGGLWYLVAHAEEERQPMRILLERIAAGDLNPPAKDQECSPRAQARFELLAEGPVCSDFEEAPEVYDQRWHWILRRT